MQEMVEEKLQNNGKVEWDFMEAKKNIQKKESFQAEMTC
jgi:hypothetical protein